MDSEFWKDTKFEKSIPSLEFHAGKSIGYPQWSCWGLQGTILDEIIQTWKNILLGERGGEELKIKKLEKN